MPGRTHSVAWLTKTLALAGCLLVCCTAVWAQSIFGTVNGTIKDETGAVIAGAKVEIKSLDTGQVRETTTDERGYYRVSGLTPGNYSLTATAQSFDALMREPIRVEVSSDASVDMVLRAGAGAEIITILGEAPLIETNKSQISKGVESKRIMELPGRRTLNGLALLQPGVVNNQNGRPGSGFAVNGARTRSNNFTIDGTNNNDPSLSIPIQNLPPEAIGEFQIITNNFSAEFGRNAGAIVNVLTRSGTNEFHGNVQYTYQGNAFDSLTTTEARTFDAAKKRGLSDGKALRSARGVVTDSLGGFTLGGPIKKEHTFFFTSYDLQRFRTTSVPLPAFAISPVGVANLRANASKFAPGALDFLLNTFPVANDPTPRGVINVSVGSTAISVPLAQYNRALDGSLPYGTNFWRWLMKVDTRLSSNDNLSFRYLMDRLDDPGAPIALPPGNNAGTVTRNYNGSVNYVRSFGPRMVNEFRFSYADRGLQFPENFPPQVTITGFNTIGNANFPQFRNSKIMEFTDNFTYTVGRHTLRFGGSIQRIRLESFFAPNSRGAVTYRSMTDLLLDRNAAFQQFAGSGLTDAVTYESGLFFQDDFRIKPNLTINLGIRYEYTTTPFGFFSNAKPDNNNWAPRVGFAYTPQFENDFLKKLTGNGKMVIRGGYGVSYDQLFQNILLNNSRNFPRGVNVSIDGQNGKRLYDPANRPAPPTPDDFIKAGGNPKLLPLRLFSPDKRVAQPYSQSFNLGIEREMFGDYVFKLYYIGSRGVKLVREVERNIGFTAPAVAANPSVYADILPKLTPIRDASGKITAYRLDPTRGSILVGDGLAQSTYHSMQLTVAKRFSKHFQFEGNYTWSAFINDSDDILGGQANNTLPANPLNLRLDRARSGLDQPHRFVANYLYEVPRWQVKNGVLDRVLNGWLITGVTTLASGTPFTVLNAANSLGILPGQIGTVTDSQRPGFNSNGVPGTAASPRLPNGQYVFNPTNSGIVGTTGRNSERTGGTATTDMALIKRIRTIGETQSLDIRWEVFNVFNRRNFTLIPINTVTADTDATRFLNLGQTNVAGRTMLITFRYNF